LQAASSAAANYEIYGVLTRARSILILIRYKGARTTRASAVFIMTDIKNSTQRVYAAITGQKVDRTPIYGWVSANLSDELTAAYGSVAAFEDKYEFDAAHIFGGPATYGGADYEAARAAAEEFTPDILLDVAQNSPDNIADYENIRAAIAHHKERGRFCYVQTPGFFEQYNGYFGIENQLCYLLMYPDEIAELYRRQRDWTKKFADHCIELGADMIHISDDWGAQRGLMFSPELWRTLIFPNLADVVAHVHKAGALCSLHSDGCIADVVDGVVEAGIDCAHPWQEAANMPYSLYLDKYQDKLALLGGVCIQTTLGFGDYKRLEAELRRVFGLLRGKRWICCTTHFVQQHCTIDELAFAYDLIYKLAREQA